MQAELFSHQNSMAMQWFEDLKAKIAGTTESWAFCGARKKQPLVVTESVPVEEMGKRCC